MTIDTPSRGQITSQRRAPPSLVPIILAPTVFPGVAKGKFRGIAGPDCHPML